MLENKYNFSQIANNLDKDPTTIFKEVKAHTIIKNVGAAHATYNACEHRFTCTKSHICIECISNVFLKSEVCQIEFMSDGSIIVTCDSVATDFRV